jgi:hypothetical protein
MNEQEAQQAQTIADIRSRHVDRLNDMMQDLFDIHDGVEAHRDIGPLLEIVDSQAQKIKHYEAELRTEEEARDILGMKIVEQAKEIERLQYKTKALELRRQHGV